ncbi:FAD-binding domain-containing protein [Byssothecium circinans]|uniref:FAD-binding domain-containing protein n=1 Tax=Byssothecium circinans TaxID=147558 RepID=A0A6A5U7Q3_9PLEO|nr:FAD-binding domain-containing protein [Byssothecium circinans]
MFRKTFPWISAAALLFSFEATAQNATIPTSEPSCFSPCDALISADLTSRILLTTSPLFEPQVQSYWATNARLRPCCFFLPHTTEELSLAITTLSSLSNSTQDTNNVEEDWHIAIRSGGHSYPGSNNIEAGLTIDFSHMNASWYNASTSLVSLQPGGRWRDVYAHLHETANVTVTGGRDGDVGVGGFMLGGGNSYHSGKNGFACDTVVNYEVVLANGSVVQANADENPELFRALKGGGMNFGIVTRFDAQAMPAVDLAYGQHVMAANNSLPVIDAVVDFTEHAEQTKADHLIALYLHGPGSSDMIIAIRVNTEGDLNTTSFDKITEISAIKESWSHTSLAAAANSSQVQSGTMNVGFTLTFRVDAEVMRYAAALQDEMVKSLGARIGEDNFMAQMFFQPLPAYYSKIGEGKVWNMLGLDRIGGNAILWTAGVGVVGDNTTAFAVAEAEMRDLTANLKEFTVRNDKASGFVYLNYADRTQDPLGSYGLENLDFMEEVAAKYDPEGWWQRMVPGGFKLSRADT